MIKEAFKKVVEISSDAEDNIEQVTVEKGNGKK
jgi:hypothetical protein